MHDVYQAHFNQVGEKPLLSSIQMLTLRRFKSFSLSVPIILGLIFGTCCAPKCSGYSVLTHEAIIDAAWKESIVSIRVGLEQFLRRRVGEALWQLVLQ